MIPKIIHACWFGSAKIPAEQKEFIEGWRRLNPDWEIKIWTEEMFAPYLDDSVFIRSCMADKKYGFLSDYFRLVVLYEFGGVYMDTDVELKKPLDEFINCKMFMGFIYDSLLGTALFGTEKGNPLMLEWKEILEKDFANGGGYQISNNWVTKYFLDRFPDFLLNGKRQSLSCGIELFPKDWFERYQTNKKSGGGYAEHHCANSWKKAKNVPLFKRILKKLLPRKITSWAGHRRAVKLTPYYSVYLEHKKRK